MSPRRRRIPRRRWTTVALTALAVLVPANALAYWAAVGTGSATPTVASFEAPTASVAAGGGTLTVSWVKVAPPGTGEVKYYVTRTGGTAPKSNCPTSAGTAETETQFSEKQGGLRCTDEGLGAGETRHYTVTAIWRTWTNTSAEVSGTATEAVAKFVVSAEHAETAAGTADNLTITAENASNHVIETYVGSHALTWEASPAEAPSGERSYVTSESGSPVYAKSEGKFNFTAGRAQVSGSANGVMLLFDAATTTITVKTAEAEGSTAVTVHPGAFKSFHVEPLTAEPTAGTAFEVRLTAWDEWHNVITTYVRTAGKKFLYSGAEASPSGNAATYGGSEPTFASGVATVTGFTFYKAASTTLAVEEETSLHKGEATFTVKPPAASSLGKSNGHYAWEQPKVSAGTLSTPCLFVCEDAALGNAGTFMARVAVTDRYGNVVTNLGGGHELVVESSAGTVLVATLTIAAEGPAESTAETGVTTPAGGEGTAAVLVKRKPGSEAGYKPAEATLRY